MYKKISEYGLIGDMHFVALVSCDGSIDYCSMPHMDSPTVFASLLDDEKGGYFSIRPKEEFTSEQSYVKDTNILSCKFRTDAGESVLTDFVPVHSKELFEKKDHIIHRCLKVTSGSMEFRLEFYPRPLYAAALPTIEKQGDVFKVKCGDEEFSLIFSGKDYRIEEKDQSGFIMSFSLEAHQDARLDFIYGKADTYSGRACSLKDTEQFWRDWIHNCIGERCAFFGEYEQMINRSLLVLKLLTFQPTGAIIAAPTTSLPESIGNERNWDYRFTWIRDASFTLKALFALGHITEADSFIHWLHSTYKKYGSKNLQVMYSLEGEDIIKEQTLDYLKGYRGSRPVRIGNEAFNQRQWDIYGEIMDSAMRLSDYAGKIDETVWPFFRDICNLAVENWRKPDDGIWEVRNGPFHFVYSKVMCWVALDRGIRIAKRYGFDCPLDKWERERDRIKQDVLDKGYNKELGSFTQSYGSKEFDSSLLLLALVNFLPIDDKRMQGTIEACRKYLMKDGFLMRYSGDDGLGGEEGAFILCNFWLVECLALSGRLDEAKNLLGTTQKGANHLGLFSEEFYSKENELLGNFPQAFSHIGYINAASAILNVQMRNFREKMYTPLSKRMEKLISLRIILNRSKERFSDTDKDIAARLKASLNKLQGAFFNVLDGRVNYEAMRRSEHYRDYLESSGKLNSFNPSGLRSDEEKKAFWINIYNILIIQGVIELDIRNSVKEVFNFFGRIGFNIDGLFFSPDDIEHGILRGNRPHPLLRIKQFSPFDRRKKLCAGRLDPRIHFALVCATGSCPPVEFYDVDNVDNQLDTAARSFLNRKGLILDKNSNTLYLSQIFKWYGHDFGKGRDELLKFILRYIGSPVKEYVVENLNKLRIEYLPYDWNLNRIPE